MAHNIQVFTPQVPANNKFSNVDTNAIGSKYATLFGHGTTPDILRAVRYAIFDAAPKQYYDLKILMMKTPITVNNDEDVWYEKGFGREPVIATGTALAGVTQTFTVTPASLVACSPNDIITYPGNQKGTVTAINTGAGTITISAMTGQTLPAVAINDVFANLSTVEADGDNSIRHYSRIETIERYNLIQMFIQAVRFGKMEQEKLKRGATTNYLDMNMKEMMNQFRIGLSNALWNGDRGEVTLDSGVKAKTMGGIFPSMVAAGSPNTSTTLANVAAAVENLALSTEFGDYGETRFLYGTPRLLLAVSKAYKSPGVTAITQYRPDDKMAQLNLESINIGSSRIVLVPMKRFEEPSCFPAAFASRLILVPQENVQVTQFFAEEMGNTLNRKDGGTLNNFTDYWVSTTMGIRFDNPLAGGWIDTTP